MEDDASKARALELAVLGGKDELLSRLADAPHTDSESEDEAPEEYTSKKGPVWVDQDDEKTVGLGGKKRLGQLKRSTDGPGKAVVSGLEYGRRLRRELERTAGGTPAWAVPKPKKQKRAHSGSDSSGESEEEEVEAGLLRRTGGWLAPDSRFLPKDALRFRRLQDPTFGHRIRKPICSVEFHPSARMLLVASEGQKVQLFKLQPKAELATSVAFESFPVSSGGFVGPAALAVASPRAPFIHLHNIAEAATQKLFVVDKRTKDLGVQKFVSSADGKYICVLCAEGTVHVISGSGHGWLGELRHNGHIRAAAIPKGDPTRLFAVGDEGLVYVWDLASRACVHKFHDEGCLRGTGLAVGDDSRLLAVGSSSGVVNVYDLPAALRSATPKPKFTVESLTTAADTLAFAHGGELLLLASSRKDGAARLVHVRSASVFHNWPGKKAKIRTVRCASFDADDAHLALGNEQGQAVLFRLHHFAQKTKQASEEVAEESN